MADGSPPSWVFTGYMYGLDAAGPPRDWPFDRALVMLVQAIEESPAWRAWWETSTKRSLKIWFILVTSSDLEQRLAENTAVRGPSIRKTSRAVHVERAIDVEAARDGDAEQQRRFAEHVVGELMCQLAYRLHVTVCQRRPDSAKPGRRPSGR